MLGEIYKITCKVNNKSYIGQVVQEYACKKKRGAKERWKTHIWEAKNGHSSCKALSSAILKYGAHNFVVRILLICEERQLNYFESKYVRQHNTLAPNGYNLRHGGGSRSRMSETSRKLISIAKSGPNNHMFGKHHTDETKRKIGLGNTGKVRSVETRIQISNTKGRNEKNAGLPMYVYAIKKGYQIKYHPNLTQTKATFTSSFMSQHELLDEALAYLNKLNLGN